MMLKDYRSNEAGMEWYATDASWVPGCQAEDEWLLEAWERMTLLPCHTSGRIYIHPPNVWCAV